MFLLALCFSIFLEAVKRFIHIEGISFDPILLSKPDLVCLEVSNPRLVVIVGSVGLAFNIIGLFLFHGKSKYNRRP